MIRAQVKRDKEKLQTQVKDRVTRTKIGSNYIGKLAN